MSKMLPVYYRPPPFFTTHTGKLLIMLIVTGAVVYSAHMYLSLDLQNLTEDEKYLNNKYKSPTKRD